MLCDFRTKLCSLLVIASTISFSHSATAQTTPLQGNAMKNGKAPKSLSGQEGTVDDTQTTSNKSVQHTHVTHITHATRTTSKPKTFFARHPMIKDATIGAGVGAAAGGVTGLISHRGIMHGALVGAGSGAGVGAIHASKTMKRHPYMRDAAEGAVGGLGLGLAASRSHGKAAAATGIGAAAGLGYRYFKDNIK